MRLRHTLSLLVVALLTAPLAAQTVVPVLPDCQVVSIRKNTGGPWQVTIQCAQNGAQKPVVGDRASVTRLVATQVAPTITAFTVSPSTVTLGQSVTFTCAATGTPTPTLTLDNGAGACPGLKTVTPPAVGTFTVTLTASNGVLPVATRALQVTVNPVVTPTTGIFGDPIDPSILGNCTAARHDTYVTTREGTVYRTWHPQADSTGCIYAHEHGDNPASLTDPTIALPPPAFGYIVSKTPGHPIEPHEGFKISIENPGAVNDEGRVNRIYSRSVFHMGTGAPGRFTQPHHSADIYVRHPEFGLVAYTQLMMNTGVNGIVCDPRFNGPQKDVVAIDFVQRCGGLKLGSLYEIWSTEGIVRAPDGHEVYRAFATPAVFDPITAFNPANPTETVYIGGTLDSRVLAIMEFPGDAWWWDDARGCDRESYAQPGYWYNQGGPTIYYTNSFGQSVAASDPLALAQSISAHNSLGAPATTDGLQAFKSRPGRWCGNRAQLRLKN